MKVIPKRRSWTAVEYVQRCIKDTERRQPFCFVKVNLKQRPEAIEEASDSIERWKHMSRPPLPMENLKFAMIPSKFGYKGYSREIQVD